MPSLKERLDHLAAVKTPARLRALTQAFQHADSDEVDSIATMILTHPSKQGYSVLLARYYQMSTPIRAQILKGGPFFSAALVDAARSEQLELRRLALQLLVESGDTQALPAIEAQFQGASVPDEILELAGRALLAVTSKMTDSVISARKNDDGMRLLDRTVAAAVDQHPIHRRPEPLLCAAMLSRSPGPSLRAFFADTDHPSHFALRGVLKQFDDAYVADYAIEWLCLESLAPQVLDRLAVLARSELLPRMLSKVHLAHLPAVHRRLQRQNSRYPASIPAEAAVHSLDDARQRSLVQWLGVIPMSVSDRVRHLGEGLSFAMPSARLGALWSLMKMQCDEADAMIESFCFDPDEQISRLALRHILRCAGSELPRLLQRLCASPHESVRRLAAIHLPIEDFDAVWHLWPIATGDPTSEAETGLSAGTSAARALLRSKLRLAVKNLWQNDRQRVVDELRARLLRKNRETQLRAIRLVREWRLIHAVELELLAIAGADDARITSAVMSSFGDIRSPASREALLAGMQHADPRVRANAIESLQHRRDVPPEEWRTALAERVVSNENRIRANAIRAMASLDQYEADRQLEMMLDDSRPMHRISALWVVERIGSVTCASQIARVARDDEVEPVRQRAQRAAARLLARMHSRQIAERGVLSIHADEPSPETENQGDTRTPEPGRARRLSLAG